MSELSRSHTANIADTRFAAAIREAGRLAVRAMSGYGMAACGAKRSLVARLFALLYRPHYVSLIEHRERRTQQTGGGQT